MTSLSQEGQYSIRVSPSQRKQALKGSRSFTSGIAPRTRHEEDGRQLVATSKIGYDTTSPLRIEGKARRSSPETAEPRFSVAISLPFKKAETLQT